MGIFHGELLVITRWYIRGIYDNDSRAMAFCRDSPYMAILRRNSSESHGEREIAKAFRD